MKQILHILKKDLRRYAWAWITLLACAVIEVYLHGTTAGLLDSGFNQGLSMLTSMLGGILFFVVIVMVVQEETLADPDAYWLARPVGRGKLLISKLLFLGILITFGQIAETATLILNGGAARAPFALLEALAALAIWQGQVFLAAQTRSLPRYLLLFVSLIVGLYALMFAMLFMSTAWDGFHFDFDYGVLPSTCPPHLLAAIQTGYWLLIGMGLLTLLYYKRRTRLAWGLLVPAFFVSGIFMPSDSFFGQVNTDIYLGEDTEAFQIDHLRKSGTMHTAGEEFVGISAVFRVNEEMEARDAWAIIHAPSIQIDENKVEIESSPASQRFEQLGDGLRSIQLGYVKRSDLNGDETGLSVEFSLNIVFSKQVPVDFLSLEEGASFVRGGNRLVVRSIYRNDNNLDIRLAGSVPSYSFEPSPASADNEAFDGKFSFALADSAGQPLRDFRLSNSWSVLGETYEGEIEVFLNDEASLENYSIIVYAREITGSAFDYVRASAISFQK